MLDIVYKYNYFAIPSRFIGRGILLNKNKSFLGKIPACSQAGFASLIIAKEVGVNFYSGFLTSQVILIFALTESAAEQYLSVAILATFSKVSNEVSGETRVYLE